MSNIIDTIQVSGVTYTIAGSGSGNSVVEITQAQYDALVSGGTVDPTILYIITDAQAGDLTQYWTSAQTQSAITEATSGKQDTLVSGTNIKTINNQSLLGSGNIDIQGGGGKAIEAGRGISITTGETADTVSFNLPISAGTGDNALVIASDTYDISNKAKGNYSVCFNGGGLHPNNAKGTSSFAQGMDTKAYGNACHSEGYASKAGVENNINIQYAHAEGDHTEAKGTASHAEGSYTIANNWAEHASGRYNNSVSASTTFGDSGNTLFSVGNGTANNARHNAFEIRQNGDIYLSLNGQDVKLQDQLGGGGGGGTIDPSLDSGSTNAVANSAITEAVNSKVNIADNNVSGFTYEASLKNVYNYSDEFAGPIYVKYGGDSSISFTDRYAGDMTIYYSQYNYAHVHLNFDVLNGAITATSTSSEYITITIQDGEAIITPSSGCYFADKITSVNYFVFFRRIVYSSGQSANVIENTVYPMFGNLKDELGNAVGEVGLHTTGRGGIGVNYTSINGTRVTGNDVQLASSTIYMDNDGKLNTQFATPQSSQKVLNTGRYDYCYLFNYLGYSDAYDDLTITFNPEGYEGGNVSFNFNLTFIKDHNTTSFYSFTYSTTTSGLTYWDSSLDSYCTKDDTISTDYKLKITAKDGYKINTFRSTNCSICGVDNEYPENYIVTLVTITSNVQNGQNVIDDIYSTLSGKQDTLSAGTGIDITNNVISATGGGSITIDPSLDSGSTNAVANSAITTAINAKADVSAVTAVAGSLSGYVTTDTAQEITGEKTFVGEKKLKIKQSGDSSKIGFTLYNSASTNNELATFEFRPNTYTVGSVQHPLLYLGHYRNTNTANAGVPQTVIGFRQYDQVNSAAYHLFAPLPEEAKTPFSLTTSFQNYFMPLGFKVDSSTMVKTDNTGVVDLTNAYYTKAETTSMFGGYYTKTEINSMIGDIESLLAAI